MHRRRQHGSSGELDVFGATRYFAGVATAARPIAVVVGKPQDMIIQVKKTTTSSDKKTTEEEGHHHAGQLAVAGVANTTSTHRSKLAAFLGSLVSPESTSFRNRKKPPPASSTTTYDDDDPPPKLVPSSSSSTSSGRTSIDDVVAAAAATVHGGSRHDDDDDDLGVAALWKDRRLQGVRVVRCGRCDEERWVVRCGACAWEEEHLHHHHHGHETKNAILGAAATSTRYGSQSQVLECDREVVGDDASDWESDSSSDLFELDLEST
uniref:Uncharacterized protein n=1 Tax=Oryza punctata TaxID=4537 RepID=A0A0E0KF14_ORYPU